MNEGCHGGWGIFNGMFLEDYYTVSRDDAPYLADVEGGSCSAYASLKPRAKVLETYFIGGHYNGMSESDMMWELRARGPFLLDFNAGKPFKLYESGILSEDGFPSLSELISEQKNRSQILSDTLADAPSEMTPED
jgi:hypothetical protein